MWQSDFCEKHTTLHANIEFFCLLKKINNSKSELMGSVTHIITAALEKDLVGIICMRVINIIIVNIKYQDAAISCFLFEVETY